MERRLASGTGDARKIKAAAAALAETPADGRGARRRRRAGGAADGDRRARRRRSAAEEARRDEHRAAQTARKEALAAEAEELAANSTQWKAAGDRLREILDEWRTITRAGPQDRRRAVEALLGGPGDVQPAPRLALRRTRPRARRAPDRPRRRCASGPRSSPTPPTGAPTAATFRDLLAEWKAAGRAAKDVDDALWQRFKAAQDKFFSARNAVTAERDAEFERQRRRPRRRCWPRRRSIDTSDLDAARAALRDDRRQVGRDRQGAPRARRRPGAAAARRREEGARRRRSQRRSDPEAQARADQFRERAEQFEQQAEKAEAAGRTKDAEQARASADAVAAVGRGRGRGARQASARSGAWSPSARSVSSLEAVQQPLASALRRRPCGAPPRRRVARAVRAHTTRAQWNVSTITVIQRDDQPDAGPGMRCGDGLAGPHREHAEQAGHRRPGQRDPRQRPAPGQQRQHREPDAEHQRPARRTPATAARSPRRWRRRCPTSTSQPLRAAGVRQHERQQQHEHQDRDDQRPCARVDLPRDAASRPPRCRP